MAIKVIIPSDKTKVIANSLFQWDYGQMLEIEAVEMGTEVCEIHFACSGMSEAIVRPCSFASGVGTVQIPDRCLEQTSPINAWIYRIHGTTGYTWKAFEIPVIARIRPSYEEDVPQEVYNQYTELISEVNESIDNLENGTVVVASATNAATAAHATTADRAMVATTATEADRAASASEADTALASNIKQCILIGSPPRAVQVTEPGLYFVTFSAGAFVGTDYSCYCVHILDLEKSYDSFVGNSVDGACFVLQYRANAKELTVQIIESSGAEQISLSPSYYIPFVK